MESSTKMITRTWAFFISAAMFFLSSTLLIIEKAKMFPFRQRFGGWILR